MGLFKSAPKIEVLAPGAWFAGTRARFQISLVCEDELAIEDVKLRVIGREGWRVSSGKSTISNLADTVLASVQLMGAGVLHAGTTELVAECTLPEGAPPSHALAPAWVKCELRVDVGIPWWPDGHATFEVPVRRPPPANHARIPLATRSSAASAPAGTPRIELSLASTRLVIGEVMVGSCAVFHLADDKPREIHLSFVPHLALFGRGIRTFAGRPFVTTLVLPAGSAGTAVPFELGVPRQLTPSFVAGTHQLSWVLHAATGSLLGGRVQLDVGLELLDASAATVVERLPAAPRVAHQRVEAVLARFAETAGWQLGVHAPAGELPDPTPELVIERVNAHDDHSPTVQIAYTYRGKDGTFLTARVTRFGHGLGLGLGLSITPGSLMRHLMFQDLEIDLAAWDRAHVVGARFPEQAVPFLQRAVPAVMAATKVLGPLVRWDDHALVFEQPVGDVELAQLASMDGTLVALARALAAVERTLTPPPGLTVVLADWQALARELGGGLAIGDLAIEGKLEGLPVRLGLVFEPTGSLRGVRVALGDPDSASEPVRQLRFALPRPAHDALGEPAAARFAAELVGWPVEVIDLEISDGVVSAIQTIADGHADPARVRELCAQLRSLRRSLEEPTGPYR